MSPGLLMVTKISRDKGFYRINPDGSSDSVCDEDSGHGVGIQAIYCEQVDFSGFPLQMYR